VNCCDVYVFFCTLLQGVCGCGFGCVGGSKGGVMVMQMLLCCCWFGGCCCSVFFFFLVFLLYDKCEGVIWR